MYQFGMEICVIIKNSLTVVGTGLYFKMFHKNIFILCIIYMKRYTKHFSLIFAKVLYKKKQKQKAQCATIHCYHIKENTNNKKSTGMGQMYGCLIDRV